MKAGNVRILASAAGASLLTLFFTGCAVGPDYEKPELTLPDAWHEELKEDIAEDPVDLKS